MSTDTIDIKDTETEISVTHYDDFISVYKNVYPEGFCAHMIGEFERLINSGAGWKRDDMHHVKSDTALSIIPTIHVLAPFKNLYPMDGFFRRLQVAYDNYSNKYTYLKTIKTSTTNCKIQRTDPSEGYHIWHAEAGPFNNKDYTAYERRAVVFSLYLNTLDSSTEGGETEFLYQRRRIPAVENTLVLWPASYTHMHRGNAVLGSKSKYIITGWFYYG
jgi:hypothetical protein